MTQENKDPQRNEDHDQKESETTAGSQAETTGYGTGQSTGQGTAPAQQRGQNTPSNAGNAGVQPGEGGFVSEGRTEQMSHADGSSDEHDPDV